MTDPYRAMIDWLIQCESLRQYLHYVFSSVSEGASVFIPKPDKLYEKRDILGTELRYCTMGIARFETYVDGRISPVAIDEQKNIVDMNTAQAIANWINQQERTHNYPDFGEHTQCVKVETLMGQPVVTAIDTQSKTAQYVLTVRAHYEVEAFE
jgi:hypothetical protein